MRLQIGRRDEASMHRDHSEVPVDEVDAARTTAAITDHLQWRKITLWTDNCEPLLFRTIRTNAKCLVDGHIFRKNKADLPSVATRGRLLPKSGQSSLISLIIVA